MKSFIVLTLIFVGDILCKHPTQTGNYVHVFDIQENGNVTRNLESYVGQVDVAHCAAHCACNNMPYGGWNETTRHCFCGHVLGDECNPSAADCVESLLISSVQFVNPMFDSSVTIPSTATMFQKIPVQIISGTNFVNFGILINGKLTTTSVLSNEVMFTESGNVSIAVEYEAYWACRSPPTFIQVKPSPEVVIDCPSAVVEEKEFNCSATLVSGSDIKGMEWKKNGVRKSNIDLNGYNIEPMQYSVGGILRTDRFNDYNQSFDYATEERAVFIDINCEFTSFGYLKAFEAYVTKLGHIRFMVLQPICSNLALKYCTSLKKCVDSSIDCGDPNDLMSYKSPTEEFGVFCSDALRFTNDDLITCPSLAPMETPLADYKIVWEYVVEAYTLGNNVFMIPFEKYITVHPGHVIGWAPCNVTGGDIGFYPMDQTFGDTWPTLVYNEVYTVLNDAVFSSAYPTAKTSNISYMIQAHVFSTVLWTEVFSGNVGEVISVEAVLESNTEVAATFSTSVPVFSQLTGFTAKFDKVNFYHGETVKLDIILDTPASDATYCVHWGETEYSGSCDDDSPTPSFTHTYNGATGNYDVYVKVYNPVSKVESVTTIQMNGVIDSVAFVQPIKPVKVNDASIIAIEASGTGLATLSISIGVEQLLFNVTLSSKFTFNLDLKYDSEINESCIVTVYNNLENKTTSAQLLVQVVISGLDIAPYEIISTNKTATYSVADHLGSNVTYRWDFGHGHIKWTNETFNVRTMDYAFFKFGISPVVVFAWNVVSNQTMRFNVSVQDIITGVTFTRTDMNTQLGQPTVVSFLVEQGSAMNLTILYGYKNEGKEVMSPLAVNMDVTGTALYGQGTFTYPEKGEYNVTLLCVSNVSAVEITMVARVANGITYLNVSVLQEFFGSPVLDDIEVNELLTLKVNATGSDIMFIYDFDNGSPALTTKNRTYNISYSTSKQEPYNISVTAFNSISTLTKYTPIYVKSSVEKLVGFVITNAPGNESEPIDFHLTVEQGDFFDCIWDWKDGTERTVVTYSNFQSTGGRLQHSFPKGVYVIEVFCQNRLYTYNLTATVFSYVAVTSFNIYAYEDCGDGRGLQLGKSQLSNVFNIQCEMVFSLDSQKGTNVTNIFHYGYSKNNKPVVEEGGKSNETRHRYEFNDLLQSFMEVKLIINASNPTSSFTRSYDFVLVGSIVNVTLKFDDGVHRIGTPSNISVYVDAIPYKACYELDLGDTHILTDKFVFGDLTCKSKPEFETHKYIAVTLVAGKYVPLLSHTYSDVNKYTLTVIGSNDVSKLEVSSELKIEDLPCFPPKLAWDAAITQKVLDAADEAAFFKCRRYPIVTKTIPDCQIKSALLQRSWQLSEITYVNTTAEILINKTIAIPGNDTRYVIQERSLEYGLYRLRYTVSMYDTKREKDIEDTEAVLDGFFIIKRCDLIGKIEGGTGRAVGYNTTAVINASQSVDPDKEPGTDHNLKFDFFCKRVNKFVKEDFDLENPVEISYPLEVHKAALNDSLPRDEFYGCFGNGHGKLVIPRRVPSILELDTKFMLSGQLYNIWLRISQEGRKETLLLKFDLKVVLGDPPIVSISCKLNCLAKMNPTQKISFVAVCTNCNVKAPIYSWSMISRPPGAVDNSKDKNEDELLAAKATTNIKKDQNLVIGPNSLAIGMDYIVKLSVYWSPEAIESGGFSQYSMVVNSPPSGESAECYFNKDKGIALEDKFFITCESVKDEDTPLMFYWFYKTKQTDTEWKACTLPSQGVPQSNTFILPAGDPDRQNMVQIQVIAEDLYGARMKPMLFEIPVSRKELDAASVESLLNDPAAQSDPAVMGNVMNSVLDSMKSSPSAKVDTVALKDKMVSMLANVKIDSPAGCSMVADTLDSASGEGDEITDNGLEKSLLAASNVASFGGELAPDQLAEIAAKTLSATAKFTSNVQGASAADNIRAAVESEKMLTSGAAGNMVAGEAPLSLKTANGETKVSCINPKNKEPGGVGGFELPDMLGEDVPDGGCTGATNAEGKNRYGFDESSKGVHGNTKGLSLSAGFGKQKEVKNLPKPIRLVLPNTDAIPPPASHPAYCELMRVIHLVECKVNSSNLFMKIEPWYNNFTGNLFVFMNKGTAPSLSDSQHNCTLPLPYPDNWFEMSSAQQSHFEEEERWRCMITAEQMEDYCEGRWCVGVVYYTNSTNRTTELKPRTYPVEQAACKKLNYTFYAYTRSCLYWSVSKKRWSQEGCVVSTETKDNETICYCDHLTDFGGGGPFAEPQPIDFGAAFSGFSNLGDNPTVFSVVLALIVLYFLMLVWARWKDKKDAIKVAICPLESNHSNDTYFYELNVQTGYENSSCTTANVFFILRGTQSETLPRQIVNPNRKCFLKGETDNFLLAVPYTLGRLKEIEIWHNNQGASPGWFLMQLMIRDLQTDTNTLFVCNKWLDVAEDDGLICRTLEPALKEDLTEFSFAFAQTMRKNLYDGHIWFSVFTRPLASTFTRVQRLSTCFSLLLTTMLANAMFYTGEDKPSGEAINIGPIALTFDQLRVGITSALIVVPANLLIITLFKKAGPKRDKTAEKYLADDVHEDQGATKELNSIVTASPSNINIEGETPLPEEEVVVKRKQNSGVVSFLKSILFPGREDDEFEKKKKSKNPLPHWLIYIGYFFVFITSAASAFFVILYGFTFGKEKSDKWILSMLISFLQSVFVIQPVKVILLSLLFAYITKDPVKEDERQQKTKIPGMSQEVEEDEDSDVDAELEEDAKNAYKKKKDTFKRPDERRLEECRQQRLMEKRIKTIIKEIIVHLMFVLVCLMVAYAASDPASFYLSDSTRNLAEKNGITNAYFDGKTYAEEMVQRKVKAADEISNRLEWFDWIRYSVVEYLFPIGWYNDDKNYKPGFVADNEASKVLAMARIRQLRVKNNTCTKLPTFEHLIVECNAGYSIGSVEQTENFHYGWTPPLNRTMTLRLRRGKRKALYLGYESPWKHQSAMELNAFPFFGKFSIYNGASYSVSIGPKKKFAKKIVAALKDNFWVDRYTRALITEANIYNANTNLLLIVTMIHEIIPTGGWNFYYNIQSLRLYRYVGGLGSVIMLFDFIFCIITIVGLYRAIKYSKRRGFGTYVKNPWNLLHVIVTAFSTGAIGCTIGRALAVRLAVKQYLDEPEMFVSFAYVGQLEYFIMACIGFVVFFANLEFLRILRFNRRIGLLTKTMSIVGKPLSSFAILFMIIFMAYVSFAHCMFVDKLEGYASLTSSFIALMQMFLGNFSWDDFQNNAPTLGPLMFFTYMLSIQMVLINMFVGIVCDAFAEVREEADDEEEANVLSFIGDRLKTVTGGDTTLAMPIYMEWKTDWDTMMESFDEYCDNVIYNIKNIESDEIRHMKWFNPTKADSKKCKMLLAILGVDYLMYETELTDGLQALERKMKRMSDAECERFLRAAKLKRSDDLAQEEQNGRMTATTEGSSDDFSSDDDYDEDTASN